MPIGRRLRRAIALMMLAMLAFAHASIALAACQLDRGSLAQAAQQNTDCPCGDPASDLTPGCVAHCTADLQVVGDMTVMAPAPAGNPVLVVAPGVETYVLGALPDESPPGVPPARILFQSFLI